MSWVILFLWSKPFSDEETWGYGYSVHFSSLPKAVSSDGPGSSHFQAQCHCSHSRAVFDMSVTLAGVFEETKSGEGWGSRKGSERHPFS